MLDRERMLKFKGRGRQLASEMLGPYQKASPNNARSRRAARRARTIEADATQNVVGGQPRRHIGDARVNERPLGAGRQPKWLKRQPRLTDGQHHEVVHYRLVDGVRVRLTPTDDERRLAVEAELRRRAYTHSGWGSVPVVRYQEPDAQHGSVSGRLDVTTATTAQVRRSASRAFGQVCGACGLNHRGDCM